jgi:putative nucleotidyltransferase with HDIG domain
MTGTSATRAAVPGELAGYLKERIGQGRLELPMLPEVAERTLLLCQDERADALRLSWLVHHDQALASHLLRVANSALYAPASPIVSLQQAISRLGLERLAGIVVAITVGNRVFRVAGHEARMKALWRHAVVAGVFAKEVARLRRRNVEGAFLCGLLHDIGHPVLVQAIADWQGERGRVLAPAELEATLDELHAEVGTQLALRWKLPATVGVAIRHHHDWRQASSHAESAMIACLADLLSYEALGQPSAPTRERIKAHEVIEALNLYPDDVDTLLAQADHALQVAKELGP